MDFMSLCGTSFDYTQTNPPLQSILCSISSHSISEVNISTFKRLVLMQVHLEMEFQGFCFYTVGFLSSYWHLFLPYALHLYLSVSQGGFVWRPLCLSIPSNFPGSHRGLLCSLSRQLATNGFIILFCNVVFCNIVNSGSAVPPLRGSHICTRVYRAFSVARKMLLSWNDKEPKQLILLEEKYPQSPYQRKRERTGDREGESDNYKKSDSYYFKRSGCCGSLV